MKRWGTILIGLVVSAVTLYLAFHTINIDEITQVFLSARYEFVALSLAILIVSVWLRGLRWSVLLRGELGVTDSFWLWCIGYMFNDILPVRLGEIARSVLAARRPGLSFTGVLSSVVVERLFDMVCVVLLLVIALLGLPLPNWAAQAGLVMAALAMTGIIALAVAARNPEWALSSASKLLAWLPGVTIERARHFIAPFADGLGAVHDLRVFAGSFSLSLISWSLSAVGTYALLLAFWPQPPLMIAVLVLAAAGLGIAVPAAPSGVGPFQAAVIAALVAVNYDLSRAQSFAILMHADVTVVTILLGLAGLLREGASFSQVARQAQEFQSHLPEAGADS